MNLPSFLKFRSRKGAEPNGSVNHELDLFGTIGKGYPAMYNGMQFMPTDNNGGITGYGNDIGANAQWMGLTTLQMQRKAYEVCSPLATVIDKIAQADTNARLTFVNSEDGSQKENWKKNPKLLRIMKRLRNPNPVQTWEEFCLQQGVLCKIHGYCPVLPIYPASFDKSYCSSLWNLDPRIVTPVKNMDFDLFSFEDNKKNPVSYWTGTVFGETFKIDANDILFISDGYLENENTKLGLPVSKVSGLDFAISNICAAMEADNVLLKKKGPLGVFSYDPKPDMAGWQPMKNEQKDELQGDLKRYGLGLQQLQYIISKLPVKWNPMSFNVAELMTKETFRQGVDSICDRFSYPAELMSGKNATYENRSSAERYLYNNNIIPFSLRRAAKYNEFFQLEDTILQFDYSHVAALQEDVVKDSQAQKFLSESLNVDWVAGVITLNEYRVKKKMYKITGGDIYYNEYIKQNTDAQKNTGA